MSKERSMFSRRFCLPLVALAVLLASLACGGGGNDGGGSGSSPESKGGGDFGGTAAIDNVRKMLVTMYSAAAGNKTAQDFAGTFAPDCRRDANLNDLAKGLDKQLQVRSGLKGLQIDDI